MPDSESKNCQARCSIEKPVLACISVPSTLFQKYKECSGVFPVFVNRGVCVYVGQSVDLCSSP